MAVENAWNALKVGGYFCSYSPLISQMEKTVEKLWEYKFIEIKTIENIQRAYRIYYFCKKSSANIDKIYTNHISEKYSVKYT